jgi:cysteine desulfurase
MNGLAASAGAACHSEGVTISEVLKAIRLDPEIAKGTIRFSTGKYLDISQIIKAVEIIVSAIRNGGFSQ